MKRLRIVFAGEVEHFLASDVVGAEIAFGADLQIFEIDHGATHSGRGYAALHIRRGDAAPLPATLPSPPDRGGDRDERKPPRRCRRLLKPHLKEDPFDARAVRMLGELAARFGRMRDAENLLRRAVELAPGWTAPKANLALILGTGAARRSHGAARRRLRRRAGGPQPLESESRDAGPARRVRRGDPAVRRRSSSGLPHQPESG